MARKHKARTSTILPIFRHYDNREKTLQTTNDRAPSSNDELKSKRGPTATKEEEPTEFFDDVRQYRDICVSARLTRKQNTDQSDSRRSSMSEERQNVNEESKRLHIGSKKFLNNPPGEQSSWQDCSKLVENHDVIMCQVYREEVDTLAVFAGLFSAVLTAFIIESYKWLMLQADDVSADYLRQIVALMSGVDVSLVSTIDRSSPLPPHVMTRINTLWFSSLTLSLSSALIGIVSKQWLREFLRETGHSHQTNMSVRQIKYEGLMEWYVGPIIATIPLMLQSALFLFLIGIIDLLWHLQTSVATIITTLGSSTMFFFIITTILPGIQYIRHHRGSRLHVIYQFPFKSPQAWLFLKSSVSIINFFAWVYAYVTSLGKKPDDKRGDAHAAPYQTYASWTQFDLGWASQSDKNASWSKKPLSLARCLGFMELTFEHASLRDWIWNCLWHMRDEAVNARYVLQCFRRDFSEGSRTDLTSLEDKLIQAVKAFLDPSGLSSATSESIMYALLNTGQGAPRAEARLEHTIRIFNSFDIGGLAHTPSMVHKAMCTALQDLVGTPTSPELNLQLFYVVQSLLANSDVLVTEQLKSASAIVNHLSRIETEDAGDTAAPAPALSLDIAKEIMKWLENQAIPDTRENWSDFKSRVFWAAHIAVMLAQRFDPSGSSDTVASSHPRISDVHELVQMVSTKSLLIPADVFPTWTPRDFSMDALTSVKVSLEALAPQVQPVASVRRRSVKSRDKQDSRRTDSDGAFTQVSVPSQTEFAEVLMFDSYTDIRIHGCFFRLS
ncbi:hypothetical protein BD626DRAFT_462651 [Schizophyllum amplum]|uniref:DUF6535 domain-containing protein n=1 Tax=Schizophyllum amplum TaxID=97359 RepID=A0A550C3C7_9AGAR|nr:hypothetical protein BD626DRAFT_462651 [Auriculariopsis ampla]